MLEILKKAEDALPALLKDEGKWAGLYVDYHPPIVERLWTQWEDYRISLHFIYPCERKDALFHPHPWPSAMKICFGDYEMAMGYGAGEKTPPVAMTINLHTGDVYEMTHPDTWHYVRPLFGPSMSIMVTGKPWDRWAPSGKKLVPLSEKQRRRLFNYFQGFYCK